MYVWEQTSVLTQDTLEGLHVSAGLGTAWNSPKGTGEPGWGEGSLVFLAEAAAPVTQTWLS